MVIDDIVITGQHLEITDAIKELIHKKFSKVLNHYGHIVTSTEFILKLGNEQNIAEINVNVPEKSLNARAATDDMYKSIDEVIAKLKKQLDTYKNKSLVQRHDHEQTIDQQLEQ